MAEYDWLIFVDDRECKQSAANIVNLYVMIGSWMSSIMDLIGSELSELSAFELENLPYLNLFKILHLRILTGQYQTWSQYICPLGLK